MSLSANLGKVRNWFQAKWLEDPNPLAIPQTARLVDDGPEVPVVMVPISEVSQYLLDANISIMDTLEECVRRGWLVHMTAEDWRGVELGFVGIFAAVLNADDATNKAINGADNLPSDTGAQRGSGASPVEETLIDWSAPMTSAELRKVFDCSQDTLSRMLKGGKVRHKVLSYGKRYLVCLNDLPEAARERYRVKPSR